VNAGEIHHPSRSFRNESFTTSRALNQLFTTAFNQLFTTRAGRADEESRRESPQASLANALTIHCVEST